MKHYRMSAKLAKLLGSIKQRRSSFEYISLGTNTLEWSTNKHKANQFSRAGQDGRSPGVNQYSLKSSVNRQQFNALGTADVVTLAEYKKKYKVIT